MLVNFIKILIIFCFFVLVCRHISFFYHKYRKNLYEQDTNYKNFFFYQTPPMIVFFYLMFYFCEQNIINGVLLISLVYLIMFKSLYYFIPYFPNSWRIRFVGGGNVQLLLLLIYYLLVTVICLKGIENGVF